MQGCLSRTGIGFTFLNMKHTALLTAIYLGGNRNSRESWAFRIDNETEFWGRFLQECTKSGENTFEAKIEVTKQTGAKTHPQLRYLNAAVYPAFKSFLENAAGERFTIEQVKHILKTHDSIMFCEVFSDPLTGDIKRVPISCAVAQVDDVSAYIDNLLVLGENMGLRIETPDEFYARNSIKIDF